MYIHTFRKRIRYGETDQMGYLYYGNYPQLYEIGRAEAMRSLGTSYKECEVTHEIMMPVMEVYSRYLQPAYYDDLVVIETRLESLPTKMIHFHHTIYNEEGLRLNQGYVKLFFVDMKTNKRVSCPTFISEKLTPYFEE